MFYYRVTDCSIRVYRSCNVKFQDAQGGVAIHLANSMACKSSRTLAYSLLLDSFSLKGSTSPIDLAVHSCLMLHQWIGLSVQSCSFYTGGRGCRMILYTPYHMIHTRKWLAIVWKNDWSSFTESFQTNHVMTSFEFLLATCVCQDTVNLFRVRLMAICKENHLKTLVISWHIVWGYSVGLQSLERFATKLREEFLFEVILGISFPVSQPQGWEIPNVGTEGRLAP